MAKINNHLVEFFKKHNMYSEKAFKYIEDHLDFFDWNDEESRIAIGCAYAINKKNSKLERFRVCIPYPVDDKTTLMAVHELTHAIIAYKYLGRRFILGLEKEVLPLLYEKIYISENPSQELKTYKHFLDSMINSPAADSYRFALWASEELYYTYVPNLNWMLLRSKYMARKHKKNNR